MKKKYTKKIKYACDKCRYVKRYTKKELLILNLLSIPKNLLLILGFFTLIIIIFIGPTTLITTYSSSALTFSSNVDTELLRQLSINATSNCKDFGDIDSYCYAFNIYQELSDLRYVPIGYYSLLSGNTNTYLYGGDCKDMSRLFVSMMRSVGFPAYVICDNEQAHCIAYVPYSQDYRFKADTYVVVDLTVPGFYLMDKDSYLWDYQTKGILYQ